MLRWYSESAAVAGPGVPGVARADPAISLECGHAPAHVPGRPARLSEGSRHHHLTVSPGTGRVTLSSEDPCCSATAAARGCSAWAFHRISGVAIWAVRPPPRPRHLPGRGEPGALRRAPGVLRQPDRAGPGGAPRRGAPVPRPQRPADHRHGLLAGDDRYHRQLWYAAWVIFVVVGLPGAVHHPAGRSGPGVVTMAIYHPLRTSPTAGRRLGAGRLVPHAPHRARPVRAGPGPLPHRPLPLRPGRADRRTGSSSRAGATSSGGPSTG